MLLRGGRGSSANYQTLQVQVQLCLVGNHLCNVSCYNGAQCRGERWHATEFISSLLGLFGVFLVSRPRWLFPDIHSPVY
eukprot:857524-Amphidinium_carterae.1